MTSSRVARGRRTEVIVAEWLRDHGWPAAEAGLASLPGRDIKNTPGHAIEVKARRRLDLLAWVRQADRNRNGDIPCVILRPDGVGEAHVGDFLVIRRLADDELNLMRERG